MPSSAELLRCNQRLSVQRRYMRQRIDIYFITSDSSICDNQIDFQTTCFFAEEAVTALLIGKRAPSETIWVHARTADSPSQHRAFRGGTYAIAILFPARDEVVPSADAKLPSRESPTAASLHGVHKNISYLDRAR